MFKWKKYRKPILSRVSRKGFVFVNSEVNTFFSSYLKQNKYSPIQRYFCGIAHDFFIPCITQTW